MFRLEDESYPALRLLSYGSIAFSMIGSLLERSAPYGPYPLSIVLYIIPMIYVALYDEFYINVSVKIHDPAKLFRLSLEQR